MTPQPHALYDLLPDYARRRDADVGYPLRALLTLIGEQVDAIEADIDQQYANWFIETCADWAVPYIGDLVGYRPVAAAGRASDGVNAAAHRLNTALTPRAEIANTLAFRRRKGTLALLEELANSIGAWPSRAVEFYTLLARCQHINHLRLDRSRVVDLRDGDALARLDGPFDGLAHGIDIRRLASSRRAGRFNLPSVGVYAWRLRPHSVTHAPAYCVESEGSHCYTFSLLGNDSPLYARANPEVDARTIAQEANLPVRIRRRALEQQVSRHPPRTEAADILYGPGKSIAIYAPGWPDKGAPQPVPAALVVPANLREWHHRAPRGQILIDPETGRMVFPVRQLPKQGVWVDYHTGFPADIGGGEYHRPLAQPAKFRLYQVSRDQPGDGVFGSINAALTAWQQDRDATEEAPRAAVIEILDSAAYSEQLMIELAAGEYLQIRAADRARPAIRLLDYMAERPDSFTVSGKGGSRLVLDGLLIAGRGIQVSGPDRDDEEAFADGDLCDVTIRHSTLVPGWGLTCDCDPKRSSEPSLELVDCGARIRVSHSIIGAIHIIADEACNDPVEIAISDSIVDAIDDHRAAICASNLPLAFARTSFARCTIFGRVEVHAVPFAEDSIFTGAVRVARRQIGCMRFCYVPPGSRTPRRSHCQPDTAAAPPGVDADLNRARLRPHFTSRRYGNAGYAQLSRWCALEIRRGASDEAEMGVFHDLFQPQREANLSSRLADFTPATVDTDIIFAN
ncbi:hypothetical protein [Sphingomonas sp. 28-63-12]|uniref:hypothetical protein n=1 Tax=Sphingomonas sp. 28-63-12 TaxID=1970434 RepID=UPI000BDC9CE2|nr:MAG: hypothetical protein B7Y47_14490 [Sphingomonas sp. 28-63-12]